LTGTLIKLTALLALISSLSLSPEAALQLSDAVQNQVTHQAHQEDVPGDNHHQKTAGPSPSKKLVELTVTQKS
jgi:hypothetical protein